MKEITEAIRVRQAQIKQLQADIEALQRAASALGGKKTVKAANQPEATPETKRQRRGLSAAARKVVSERMKRYWAKRKK